jgi:hypothetical protein
LHGVCAHFHYDLVSYGKVLKDRKAFLMRMFEQHGIREERRGLMLAMAMIETAHLSPKEIDHSKDYFKDKSANASIFNLNLHMLQELGYPIDDKNIEEVLRKLNDDAGLPMVVGLLNQAFESDWKVVGTLCWVRGGETAFKDHSKFEAHQYLRAVATSLRLMDKDPLLLVDDRRIQMNVHHQTHNPQPPASGNSAAARH